MEKKTTTTLTPDEYIQVNGTQLEKAANNYHNAVKDAKEKDRIWREGKKKLEVGS